MRDHAAVPHGGGRGHVEPGHLAARARPGAVAGRPTSSRRSGPDDGRYGENPNRFQQHYQYQVILKPDPGDAQELYLGSLAAIGIDPREHDIRFVEDNWE